MAKISNYLRGNFFSDRLILVSASLAILANIILWILLASKFGYSQEPIPLHFNVVYGIDFVGSTKKIYEIPLLGLVVVSINLAVGKIIYEREKLFSYFLAGASAAVQIILLVAAIALVSL